MCCNKSKTKIKIAIIDIKVDYYRQNVDILLNINK